MAPVEQIPVVVTGGEPDVVNLLWIPLFPLLGALFNLLFGRLCMRTFGDRLGREIVHLVAIGAVAFSCFFTFSVVYEHLIAGPTGKIGVAQNVYTWIASGETIVGFDLLLDRLSSVMTMVVTSVGLLIHIFSVGYMAKDPDYHRYFAYLNLFMAAMLILVLGKSLAVTFIGWEGVGLCSYLLIGFWYTDEAKATAGRKAFIVNRIGDVGFLLGMLLIYSIVGSLDYEAIRTACAAGENSAFVTSLVWGVPVATIATMLLFLGCTGKSAQIPLYTWLPDAMAGPTPVSALIHAATMVTAGVYLVVRLNFLFALAPTTMAVIAVIGGATALYAATIGITQNDIKRVLAYSTVSQLGYMFLAVGMGAWTAAIFHLVTHAFFKACLFLGSGSVIEACHHNQDIRTMGGLRKKMPWTAGTFLVSCLAISGIPLFSGFFSKDEILLHAYTNVTMGVFAEGDAVLNYVLYAAGILGAACTAFYMFRLYFLTFEGEFRGDHHTWTHHVKEYGIMTLPLVVLAIGAAAGGLLGIPHVFHPEGWLGQGHILNEWLMPIYDMSSFYTGDYRIGMRFAGVDPSTGLGIPAGFADANGGVKATAEWSFMALSVAVAAGGIFAARHLYRTGPSEAAKNLSERLGILYRASKAKYWVDEIYDFAIVKPLRFIGGVCYHAVDQLIIDGLGVSGVSGTVGLIGNGVRIWHNGNVRRYLVVLLLGVGVVLASVYANPTISQVGPSRVYPIDGGGLRPTLGPQPIRIEVWGVGSFEVGPDKGQRRPPPAPRAERPRPPPREPEKAPSKPPSKPGGGAR